MDRGRSVVSSVSLVFAGMLAVTQTSLEENPGRCWFVRTIGVGPSLVMIDLPRESIPVTTLRTGVAIQRSPLESCYGLNGSKKFRRSRAALDLQFILLRALVGCQDNLRTYTR